MAHLSDYNTDKRFQAKVVKSDRLTPESTEEIRELLLEVEEPNFSVKVDQSIGVLVQSTGDFGNEYHHRLYSVADIPESSKGKTSIKLLVKRCNYIDDFNGERYEGVGSNFLCDRQKGDEITITGPFELPFKVPEDKSANLILIGMGTGIAPFRAFIKHIYKQEKNWNGKVRLFYGAKSGLELLYMNDENDDLTNYYDQATFKAFHALSPRPHMDDPIALDQTVEENADEILEMLNQINTYIYVAGYEKVNEKLNKAFGKILGSKEKWMTRKAELKAGKKWAEVIY